MHTPESPVKNVLKNEKVERVIMFIFKTSSLFVEKKRFKLDQDCVQVQDGYLEETICLRLASYLKEMDM